MKIINGKQLAFMPNGTVFSDIVDDNFDPNGNNGSMIINGLHIMCGHTQDMSPESGIFNGVVHMLDYVNCYMTEIDEMDYNNLGDSLEIIDTDNNDYTENDWVVVYDRDEIKNLISKLQWALEGCIEKED